MKVGSMTTQDYKGYKEYMDEKYFRKASELPLSRCMRRTGATACFAVIMLVLFVWGVPFGGPHSSMGVFGSHHRLFPKKVWQTWKVDPLDFGEKEMRTARSWPAQNPTYRYEVLTDANDLAWVEANFGPEGLNRMDIVFTYRELTAKIIKADLLRYLVMYVEGGVYADIDVEAIKPVRMFIPERWDERRIDMIVGVEIDQPDYKDHPILGPKSQSFCQWTFMCKPKLRVMMDLVENIMAWLHQISKEQKVPISEIKLDFDQVILGTGPSAFTKAILADMSRRAGREVVWNEFHDMAESKVVGGLLVLNVEAFAAGQGHSDSGNHETKHALVRHLYHASGWPTAHPRYKHPIFGQVEDCNWKKDCVARWDDEKAAFEALDRAEQDKRIAIHEKEVAAEEAKQLAIKEKQEQFEKNKKAFEAASPEVQAMLDPARLRDFIDRPDVDKAAEQAKLDVLDPKKLANLDKALAKRGLVDVRDGVSPQSTTSPSGYSARPSAYSVPSSIPTTSAQGPARPSSASTRSSASNTASRPTASVIPSSKATATAQVTGTTYPWQVGATASVSSAPASSAVKSTASVASASASTVASSTHPAAATYTGSANAYGMNLAGLALTLLVATFAL